MSLKKLASGSGYEYLTEQVAAFDGTELDMPLADYYAAKGESPGRWTGSGLVSVEGLEAGDVVTAEQMKHLFGEGCEPLRGAALGNAYNAKSVAGFDLTFSPVKSVSALWAIAHRAAYQPFWIGTNEWARSDRERFRLACAAAQEAGSRWQVSQRRRPFHVSRDSGCPTLRGEGKSRPSRPVTIAFKCSRSASTTWSGTC